MKKSKIIKHSEAVATTKPLLLAAQGIRGERTPIWFLRQAGRYLPEYRAVRRGMSFIDLCKSPKDAMEVTLQPLRRYDVDASIIFSDILVTPMAMGQKLSFNPGHGPLLDKPIRSMADVDKLRAVNPDKDLDYVGEAIDRVKERLLGHQTMIGFAGAPFTVATYMVEGQGTKSFLETFRMIHQQPRAMEALMDRLTRVTIDYLRMQVRAGAEYLMLFDTWAGMLDCSQYEKWALRYVRQITSALSDLNVPICYFPGQGGENLTTAASGGQTVTHVDWRVPMDQAISRLKAGCCPIFNAVGESESLVKNPSSIIVQGNLNPTTLLATDGVIERAVDRVMEGAKDVDAHVFNLGHGLTPATPPESLNTVIARVREHDAERKSKKEK